MYDDYDDDYGSGHGDWTKSSKSRDTRSHLAKSGSDHIANRKALFTLLNDLDDVYIEEHPANAHVEVETPIGYRWANDRHVVDVYLDDAEDFRDVYAILKKGYIPCPDDCPSCSDN